MNMLVFLIKILVIQKKNNQTNSILEQNFLYIVEKKDTLRPFSYISMTAFVDSLQFSFSFANFQHPGTVRTQILESNGVDFVNRSFFIGTTVDTKSISSRKAEVTNEIVKWSVSLTIIIVREFTLLLRSTKYRSGFSSSNNSYRNAWQLRIIWKDAGLRFHYNWVFK